MNFLRLRKKPSNIQAGIMSRWRACQTPSRGNILPGTHPPFKMHISCLHIHWVCCSCILWQNYKLTDARSVHKNGCESGTTCFVRLVLLSHVTCLVSYSKMTKCHYICFLLGIKTPVIFKDQVHTCM